jgi:hypothetical protein
LAWSVWALSVAFALSAVPLYWSTSPSVVLLGVPQIVAVLALAALVLAFSTVGALIVARRLVRLLDLGARRGSRHDIRAPAVP